MKKALLTTFVLLVSTGCMGVDYRIEKNQGFYEHLSPTDQRKIANKEIAVGFTPKMVYLAWGHPSHETKKGTVEADLEIWEYTKKHYDTEKIKTTIINPDTNEEEEVEIEQKIEHEVLKAKVTFQDGHVIDYEQYKR